MKTKTVRKLQKGGGAGRGGDPRDFGFSASAAQASRSSSAPQSSPRPQPRDPVKAQQFIDSQGGDDNGSAAAIQQGIAAIAAAGGDGGKRVFAQTPMFNAAGNVVGTYGGQPEIPSLPMTPFIINEIMGTSKEPLLPPPRSAPQAPQGLFGRSAPGSFAFSETSSMRPFDMFEDPLMVPGVSSFNAYDAAMPTPVPTTSVPTPGVAPSVDTTSPPTGIPVPVFLPGYVYIPHLARNAGPSGWQVPRYDSSGYDGSTSISLSSNGASSACGRHAQEVGTAPTADTSSAPRPVAAPVPAPTPAPIPAPQPAITREAIAGDISQSAASAERPSFNPLDFTMIGMAKRLIDSLAGGGGGGSLGSTRPETRPSVMNVMRGEGDDAQMYMAATRDMPRFGISAGDEMLPPDYSPFGLRGLTSTDPANVMRNIQGAERQNRYYDANVSQGEEMMQAAPVAPPVDPAAMPTERPSWWPPYLPWPPAPPSAAPMPTYRPPPVAPVMPGQQYSTSYSGLQGAISGAGNPLMMGIGGMIRRP
jgi:hypothetical protein